jgi:hypothetical protein
VSADDPVKSLSVDERLALLAKVEAREAGAIRQAARVAWLSLAVAAILVGALIFGAWWQVSRLRGEAAALERRQSELVAGIAAKETELVELEAKVRDAEAARTALISGYRRADDQARRGFETALDADPKATAIVPRAYVQIVDEGDRQWARNLSDRLQQAGVIPVGIEHTPRAAGLRQFEVRYYKDSEQAGAERIRQVLERAGVPAITRDLNLDSNTRVRANHFEIWCPANARRFKLQPAAAR